MAAATLVVPMMLWPQAWPNPGRASYSARKAIDGPSFSNFFRATKEVSCPATALSTSKPSSSKILISRAEAKNSSLPISGLS